MDEGIGSWPLSGTQKQHTDLGWGGVHLLGPGREQSRRRSSFCSLAPSRLDKESAQLRVQSSHAEEIVIRTKGELGSPSRGNLHGTSKNGSLRAPTSLGDILPR